MWSPVEGGGYRNQPEHRSHMTFPNSRPIRCDLIGCRVPTPPCCLYSRLGRKKFRVLIQMLRKRTKAFVVDRFAFRIIFKIIEVFVCNWILALLAVCEKPNLNFMRLWVQNFFKCDKSRYLAHKSDLSHFISIFFKITITSHDAPAINSLSRSFWSG